MAIISRETAKIILVMGDSVLLCNQQGEPIWHLPGGGLSRRETPEQALRRELREEVGLSLAWCAPVTTIEASWQPFSNMKDTVRETMHLFQGQLLTMGREGITKYEKGLNLRYFPLAYVMPMESPDWMVRPLEILPWLIRVGGQMVGRYGR